MLFRKIRKFYYFIYYCNFKVMDRISDRYFKDAPYKVHGWTWPMFIFMFNLMTIDSLFNTPFFKPENDIYFWMFYGSIAVFNFFVFTYKKRSDAIIKECSELPLGIRRFGVTFFAIYPFVSIIGLFVVLFGGWQIRL
jgi:hypothetical protein